jgi:hypothetical protein
MDFELDEDQRAWRDEVRAFLRENVTPELLREKAERGFEHASGHLAAFRRKVGAKGRPDDHALRHRGQQGGVPAADREGRTERGHYGASSNKYGSPQAEFEIPYGNLGQNAPITIDDVLASPMVADPPHKLEVVMPCHGGAAVVVTSADVARRCRNRPVWVKGFGERLTFKTPTYAPDLLRSPISAAADRAFAMAGVDLLT